MDSNIISTKKLKELSDQVRMAWYRLHGGVPVRVANQRYLCDAANLQFWDKVNAGRWEPKTFAVLDRLVTAETVYCDIGAWIGPTVLYAARNCRKVYCLEPDRVAYKHLLDNIQMNRLENVLPFNMALAEKDGLRRMASPRGKRGDSMTSLLLPQGTHGMDVLCLTWQNWFALVGKPSFGLIKMDIEGGNSLFCLPCVHISNNTDRSFICLCIRICCRWRHENGTWRQSLLYWKYTVAATIKRASILRWICS